MPFPECGVVRCQSAKHHFLRMFCPEVFCRFRSPVADMPPLKGKVPAKQAVGFLNEESGSFNLWLPDSCSVRRQQAGVGPADRSPRPPPKFVCPRRQCRLSICGEARRFEETSRFNLWRLVSCSIWRQQVGAGSACRQQVGADSACPNRQCRPSIRRELCGFEETSRFNLWRLVSCSVRRQQVRAGSACKGRLSNVSYSFF